MVSKPCFLAGKPSVCDLVCSRWCARFLGRYHHNIEQVQVNGKIEAISQSENVVDQSGILYFLKAKDSPDHPFVSSGVTRVLYLDLSISNFLKHIGNIFSMEIIKMGRWMDHSPALASGLGN